MRQVMTGLDSAELRDAFEQQTRGLVRERLAWFVVVWGLIGLLGGFPFWASWIAEQSGVSIFGINLGLWSDKPFTLYAVAHVMWLAVYGSSLIGLITRRVTPPQVVPLSLALVACDGLFAVTARAAIGLPWVLSLPLFTMSHLVASLIFPWSPRQALIPGAIVLAYNAISRLGFEAPADEGGVAFHLIMIAVSPLTVTPGTLICWARHSRRMERFGYSIIQQRYGSMRQELVSARSIHESLFPSPRSSGDVRLNYRYQPMRQLGGDFLFASVSDSATGDGERMSVVVLDVTGHGLVAALSVNRLYGEIELLFADNPDVEPGEVLKRLNRYVHLTLAKHSIFVTALCARADTGLGTVEYASGGHPPAFLRGIDGTLTELGSTAMMLGAVPDADYEPGVRTTSFAPGDAMIAFTDGATEARSVDGRMLRIEGVRRMLRTMAHVPGGEWPSRLLDKVQRHRGSSGAEDDTLIVEMYRSLGPGGTRSELIETEREPSEPPPIPLSDRRDAGEDSRSEQLVDA